MTMWTWPLLATPTVFMWGNKTYLLMWHESFWGKEKSSVYPLIMPIK